MPKFSICIPTRERHVTLKSAIETVLAQTRADFELIVQDNFSSSETRAVVDSFDDPRLRYFRSDRRLAMHDNWEEALNHTTGDYILFIGDDDAVMPDCIERADKLITATDPDVLSWTNHLYYWPDVPDEAHRNLLSADVRNGSIWNDGYADDPFSANISRDYPDRPPGTLIFDGRRIAKGWYAWKGVRLYIPVYHNMISRRVIDRARAQGGRYFLDPTPDFASMAANAYFSKKVVFYARALSVSGHSGRSNGGTHGSAEAAEKSWDNFLKEAGLELQDVMPRKMPPIKFASALLYGCLANVRRQAFGGDEDIVDGISEFVHYAAGAVGAEPEHQREKCREWVKELARRASVPQTELKFTPSPAYVRPHGSMNDPLGRIFYIHVDGEAAGLKTIADAVFLAKSFSPQQDYAIHPTEVIEILSEATAKKESGFGKDAKLTKVARMMGAGSTAYMIIKRLKRRLASF